MVRPDTSARATVNRASLLAEHVTTRVKRHEPDAVDAVLSDRDLTVTVPKFRGSTLPGRGRGEPHVSHEGAPETVPVQIE